MQQLHKPKSRCTFCGSTNYGKGCSYGPHGVHVHSGDPTKCSYCGSTNYGKGCRQNPINNLHIRGGVYNNMYKENIQSFLDNKVLLKELKKEYTDFQCYKLGIIDQHGNKVKTPVTEQEKSSYSGFTKTILRLKKYLGPKLELMEATNLLEKTTNNADDLNYFKKILVYQDKIDLIVNELYKTLDEAQQNGIAFDDVKELLKA